MSSKSVNIDFLDIGSMVKVIAKGKSEAFIHPLTKELAELYAEHLLYMNSLIPYVHESDTEFITGDSYSGREFRGKWKHSYLLLYPGSKTFSASKTFEIIGFITAYERFAETDFYEENNIYLHRGSIVPEHRRKGLYKALFGYVLDCALDSAEELKKSGFIKPTTEYPVTNQTNAEYKNIPVLALFLKFGAEPIGIKRYGPEDGNKKDIVLGHNRKTFESSLAYHEYKFMLK